MTTQTWDPQAYQQHGGFVHGLAGGVLEWLDAKSGEFILDLGCGDGQLSSRIVAAGANVLGVDSSEEMIAAARKRWIEAERANAESLPFGDRTFDAVFSNAALHWVRDQDSMLDEVHRVLKPGGRFVAEMGGHGNIAAIRVALTAVLVRNEIGNYEDGVNYYPTPESYSSSLEKHGFIVEQMSLIPRPTPLPDGGMSAWLRTFRRGVLEAVPEKLREKVVEETVDLLKPALCDEEGKWMADYVRLRFIARA